jgi:predicted dehydrogenase
MQKIRWGIIGCGNVTEKKSGPAFNKVSNSELVAVMRRDAEKARDYAERHNVSRWYADTASLINDSDVNAIYIATPPSSHEAYAIASIEAGKPVYIEKPMSLDAASALRIAEAAEHAGVKVCVAHYRRHLPLFVHIKELLQQHIIGDVRVIELRLFQSPNKNGFAPGPQNWRVVPSVSGGGIFHDLAPHQLDLMYYFFGEPVLVKGVALNQAKLYDADDFVSGTVVFPGNIVFNGTWCFSSPETEEIDECLIIGSKGSMRFSIFTMDSLQITTSDDVTNMTYDTPEHVQQPMISEVVKFFVGHRDNPCSAYDGVMVMRIMDALVR